MKGPTISTAGVILFSLLFIGISSGFLATSATSRPRLIGPSRVVMASSEAEGGDDFDFMASLNNRMKEVNENETMLPLVVLDCMLPRQVLKINVNNPVFMELVRSRLEAETPFFGMLGIARLVSGEKVHLRSGVQVDIVGKTTVDEDGLKVSLKAGRRFHIDGEVDNAPQGWTQARVRFLDDSEDKEEDNAPDQLSLARAMSKARPLSDLADEWIKLARTKERQEGQIDQLLEDLGAIPESEAPTDRALWVGALINPIPALGVSLEIRPALLTAKTPEDKVEVALKGIMRSIQHMQGKDLIE